MHRNGFEFRGHSATPAATVTFSFAFLILTLLIISSLPVWSQIWARSRSRSCSPCSWLCRCSVLLAHAPHPHMSRENWRNGCTSLNVQQISFHPGTWECWYTLDLNSTFTTETDLRTGPLGHPGAYVQTQSLSSTYIHALNLLFERSSQMLIFYLKLLLN